MKKTIAFLGLMYCVCVVYSQKVSEDLALKLSRMPLNCIAQEWPNKTSHLSNTSLDHKLLPSELHPTFFGCLDWHSSVHGHWLLVKILKDYPTIANKDSILMCLENSFQSQKLIEEANYFSKYDNSNTFERTYGWAWLLKLDQELVMWDNEHARKWHKSLKPLTQSIVKLWKSYLPKQTYPNRTGVHPNTAFGLVFALDWARTVNDSIFEQLIVEKSLNFYFNNKNVPAHFEPDGSDFFSPTLEVADLMRRILLPKQFQVWFKNYYNKESIENLVKTPIVSDRNDYQIVHLDGLSFSRAWCMKGIANALPEKDKTRILFLKTADDFINNSLKNINHDNYGGSHWLASFAFYAMQQ